MIIFKISKWFKKWLQESNSSLKNGLQGFYGIFIVENFISQLSRLKTQLNPARIISCTISADPFPVKSHNSISRSTSIRVKEIEKKRNLINI